MYTINGTKKLIALKKKAEQCQETEIALSFPNHLRIWGYGGSLPRVVRKEELFIKGYLPYRVDPIHYNGQLLSDITRQPYEYYVDGKQFNQEILDKFYHKSEYGYNVYFLNDPQSSPECKIKIKRHIYNRDEVLKVLNQQIEWRTMDLKGSNSHQEWAIRDAQARMDKNNELLHMLGDGN